MYTGRIGVGPGVGYDAVATVCGACVRMGVASSTHWGVGVGVCVATSPPPPLGPVSNPSTGSSEHPAHVSTRMVERMVAKNSTCLFINSGMGAENI